MQRKSVHNKIKEYRNYSTCGSTGQREKRPLSGVTYGVGRIKRTGRFMANNWNIPDWLENEVRKRDKACVYCGIEFTPAKISKKSAASWEHIINDAKIITRENIVLCCCGCNASKGQKQLSIWLQSNYCKDRGITADSVSPIIKQAIASEQ